MRLSGKRKCCMYFHSWYLCKHGASLVGWWDHWAVAPLSAHWLRVPAIHRTSAQSPGDKWTPAAGPGTSQQVSIQPSSNSDVNICMSKLKSSTSTILWINQCNHHWVQHVSRTVVAVWGELLTNMFIHYRRRLYLWPHHIPSLLVNYPEREPGPHTTTA